MAKRKKNGRAKPAAASQDNLAEAEVRSPESEAVIAGEEASMETAPQPEASESTPPPVGEPEGALGELEPAEMTAETAELMTDSSEVANEPAETAESSEAAPVEAEPVSDPTESAGESAETVAETSTPDGAQEPASPASAIDDVWAEDRVAAPESEPAPDASDEQDSAVWAEASGENAEGTPAGEGEPAPAGQEGEESLAIVDSTQMESIIESLLFASDRVLSLNDLKRLLDERDGKKISAAVDALYERRKGTGIEVVRLSNGWHLRTNAEHARWVSRLLAGKPMRLSRAMMETLAIVAYRQPVTRPEIDEIRGVDCGPVLKTLLERGLIRIIGKKEDVGRPLLYGTTPEFLRVFNLRELTELPTLREYAELNSEQQAVVDAKHGPADGQAPSEPAGETAAAPSGVESAGPNLKFVPRGQLPEEPEDNDPLLDELDSATKDASRILGAANEPPPEAPAEAEASAPAPAEPSQES